VLFVLKAERTFIEMALINIPAALFNAYSLNRFIKKLNKKSVISEASNKRTIVSMNEAMFSARYAVLKIG